MNLIANPPHSTVAPQLLPIKNLIQDRSYQFNIMVDLEVWYCVLASVFKIVSGIVIVEAQEQGEDVIVFKDLISLLLGF